MEVRPGHQQTEVGVIPGDWEVRTLEATTDCLDNLRVPLNESQRAKRRGDIPYCGANGVLDHIDDFVIDDDIILIAEDGGYFDEYMTRPIAYRMTGKCWVNNHAHILKAKLGTDQGFIYYSLVHKNILRFLARGTRAKLNRSELNKIELSLPPTKAEQEAIAEALSNADALIESLEQLLAKKRKLKQGVMQELLTGRKRLAGFSGEWEVKRLGDVATFHKGKGLPKSAIEPFGADPCIHYGELFTRYPETIQEIISRTNSSGDCARSVVNDVLMPTSDVTPNGLAKASCVRTRGVILGGDILVIRSNADLVFGSFLSYVIRHAQEQVLQLVTGTTVFHLYAADMKKFTFSIPSVVEQRAIVAVLDDMDGEIAVLEAKLAKARSIKQGMTQELLTGRIRLV